MYEITLLFNVVPHLQCPLLPLISLAGKLLILLWRVKCSHCHAAQAADQAVQPLIARFKRLQSSFYVNASLSVLTSVYEGLSERVYGSTHVLCNNPLYCTAFQSSATLLQAGPNMLLLHPFLMPWPTLYAVHIPPPPRPPFPPALSPCCPWPCPFSFLPSPSCWACYPSWFFILLLIFVIVGCKYNPWLLA